MKKGLFLLIMFLICITSVNAKVKTHIIDAEIEIAGALRVKELIVVEGNIKDFKRTINYKMIDEVWDQKSVNFDSSPIYNGVGIDSIKIAAYENLGEININELGKNIKNFFKELDPNSKDKNFYTNVKNNMGSTINIHYESDDKSLAFYLEYVVTNVIVNHEDIKELNYTFKNLDIGADNTAIRVIIPYPTDSEEYNVWVHGPANGVLKELVNNSEQNAGVYTEFSKLKNDVNIRMTLPDAQVGIDVYLNKSNVKALDEIVAYETKKLDKQNNPINEKIIKYFIIAISCIYIISSCLLFKDSKTVVYNLLIILGVIICLINYLLKINLVYIYFIMVVPVGIKIFGFIKKKEGN